MQRGGLLWEAALRTLGLRMKSSLFLRGFARCTWSVVGGGWLLGLQAGAAQDAGGLIEAGRYADDAAVRAAWVPMGGTAAPTVAMFEGHPVVRMRCNFAGTKIERASWDRRVALDLRSSRAVELEFFCLDAAPVSYFSLYFQSGEGWYTGTFYPEKPGWNRITVTKAGMSSEGQPGGGGSIRTVRLSAWRGTNQDTEILVKAIRRVGVLGEDAVVALVRGDAAVRSNGGGGRGEGEWLGRVAQHYEALGIETATLSDLELDAATLRRARVVVLPYNPSLPDAAVEALLGYVRGGGRLLSFYGLPAGLRSAVGIEGGAWVRAGREGEFASMRFEAGVLPGAPPVVRQASWNLREPKAVEGRSRVAARWQDARGEGTGRAAVVVSSNCIEVAHVLLADDAANKRRLLLAMTGYLAPEIWRQAVEAGVARVGQLAGYRGWEDASEGIRRLGGGKPEVAALWAEAGRERAEAVRLTAAGEYPRAYEEAARAARRALEAYCAAQEPVAGEFRGFWCHSAFGVPGLSWEESMARLAENGFTAILPNMLWGGVAYYPSRVLPVAAEVAERGDQVERCLAACRKHGLQIHVWKVNWNLGAAPKEFVERMRREGRLQADVRGKEEPWLCPSHPENRQLEVDSMVEVVRRYQVDGMHFDYIRYPGGDHCFCAGCRARFAEVLGREVVRWPEGVTRGGEDRDAWLEWRRGHITAVVQSVSERAREVNPAIRLSAAVFRNWPTDRDGVGQDWKLWCENGYLDFVCPMDYTSSDGQFENWVKSQKGWAGRTPCYPGIGAWELTADRVVGQIGIVRREGMGGFVLFNYDGAAARELVPLLGRGVTRAVGGR